jgi:ribosomal protein L15
MKATYEGGQMPIFRRLPKRGFSNATFRTVYAEINVGDLASLPAGTKVGPEELRKAGLLRGHVRLPVKVLGRGELKVALTVAADKFSASAKEKIEKAGGKVEYLGGPPSKSAPDFAKDAKLKKRAAAIETAKKGSAKKGGKSPKGAKGGGKQQAKGKAQKSGGGGKPAGDKKGKSKK